MTEMESLRNGELLLLPTDTLPGIHGRALDVSVPEKLSALKKSQAGRPFLLLFSSADQALHYGACAHKDQELILRQHWPGCITALLQPLASSPSFWVHEGRSMAARVPELPQLRELIASLGEPLFSTSVNISGGSPALDMEEAKSLFPQLPFLQWPVQGTGQASTVVDLTEIEAQVLRQGTTLWPSA